MRLIFLCLMIVLPVWAHQTSVTAGGEALYWPNENVPIYIRTNTIDLSSSVARNIILNSMAQWNQASSAKVSAVSSSANEVRFSSDFSIYGSAVIGVTELSYNSSGAIQKAIIYLNDNYYFTANEDSFADGSVFLGDVVTHELGHLFGLSHSEVLNSSMFYSSFPGQSTLSADDKSGIRQKYGSSSGKITGSVRGGNDIGVLGVHVMAISRKNGETIGVITDEDGNFEIAGLDLDDSYYLYTTPIKNLDSLPGHFANVQTTFCPASYVGSFFNACGRENEGLPQPITLVSGQETVDVGVVTINCSLKASEEYSYQKIQSSFSPITIWDNSDSGKKEHAFIGYFSKQSESVWTGWDTLKADLSAVSVNSTTPGYVKINLITHTFGNLLEYELQVLRNGVLEAEEGITESSLLGTYNTDISITLPMSSNSLQNIFEIKIRARKLKLSDSIVPITFPSASDFTSDSHMPYLLMIGVLEGGISSTAELLFNNQQLLSDNASCLDAPFTYEVKNAKVSDSSMMATQDDLAAVAGAACGTIEPPHDGPPPGSSLLLLVTGFFLSLFFAFISKKSKNFLS